MAKSRLGKGLGALFPTIPEEKSPVVQLDFDSNAVKSEPSSSDSRKTVPRVNAAKNKGAAKKKSKKEILDSDAGLTERSGKPSKDSRASIPGWDQIAHPSDMFFSTTETAPSRSTSPSSEVDRNVSRETLTDKKISGGATQGEATTPGEQGNSSVAASDEVAGEQLREVEGAYLATLAVDEIEPNEFQPRSVFAEEELKELSDSIKEVGVLQPIVVRKRSDADASKNGVRYELIMGERRLRASKLADVSEIPAIVRTTEDSNMLRDALLENLHRVQLNPLEEAAAYEQMIEEFGLTQAQLSQSVSKSRPQIANTLRLLQLPGSVQKRVASGVLSAGHARALLALGSEEQMVALAKRIVAEGLSVRSTEEIVALQKNGDAPSERKRSSQNYWKSSALPQKLGDRFDTLVTIRGTEKKGKIEITFASQEDLQRIADLLVGEGTSHNSDGWM